MVLSATNNALSVLVRIIGAFAFSLLELLLLRWFENEGFDKSCVFRSALPPPGMFFACSITLAFVGVGALSFPKGRLVFLVESDAVLRDLLSLNPPLALKDFFPEVFNRELFVVSVFILFSTFIAESVGLDIGFTSKMLSLDFLLP